MTSSVAVREDVPLAPLTTLGLGGPARCFVEAGSEAEVQTALVWAESRGLPVLVLGGGSNLVVSDDGFAGLVVRVAPRGLRFEPRGERCDVEVAAGEPWDEVVAQAVERGLAGLECLSGIPGLAGGTPIQNVGAYGQEVSEVIVSVRALDRGTGAPVDLARAACGFGYRTSALKRAPGRFVVLAVRFSLTAGGPPALRYPELAAALGGTAGVTVAEVRDAVLGLRRRKSMVIDPSDPNRRSVGSFFMNPVMPAAEADRVVERARADGIVAEGAEVPRFPAGEGRTKLAAAWLIERAGFAKGLRRGGVGISSRHALALVHHGGGTTAELLALARDIRERVRERFGVWLEPEPVVVGAGGDDPLVIPAAR